MASGTRWLRSSRSSDGGKGALESARGIAAMAAAVVVVAGVGMTGRTLLDLDQAAPVDGTLAIVGGHMTTSDDWTERLSDPSAWRSGRYSGGRSSRRAIRGEEPPPEWRDPDEDDDDERPRERTGWNGNSYRTVCVRLCDGYFFPISFATTPDRFARDEAACRSTCRSAARLYVYPNPGGEPEQMVSVDGQPYSALSSAFLFRTKYDAACTCKPHPWEQEALARHRAFADAQLKTGGRNTRTVARTMRSDTRQADLAASGDPPPAHQGRPEGAMLLGADEARPRESRRNETRREARPETQQAEQPRHQRGGSYGRRSDWQSRAFGGF